jgi:uncharacterized membrane protein YbhN (UPF0104 family)
VARVRGKRIELFGGNLASELLYALALGATCLAYGVHLNLAQLVFANTAASVLSSLIPVPGGIGAAEATLSAALIAMGVDESSAFAIAITQRLCTFYLRLSRASSHSVGWTGRATFDRRCRRLAREAEERMVAPAMLAARQRRRQRGLVEL